MYVSNYFKGAGDKLPNAIFETYADNLDVEPEMLQAITIHESPRGSYLGDGRLRILYEAHIFSRLTNHVYDESHPAISSRKWNRKLYGAPGYNQHSRLEQAMSLDPEAALQSCSYGMFQIMGFHYKDLGYKSPLDMVQAFAESETYQFEGFIRLLKKKKLVSALRDKDFDLIGYRYNGPGYKRNDYDRHLARIYRELKSHILRKGSRGSKVVDLQKLLIKNGYKNSVSIDGIFGENTKQAVKSFQEKNGLNVDGVVGPQTYAALASVRVAQTPLHKSKRVGGSVVTGGTGITTVIEGIDRIKEANDKVGQIIDSPAGELVKDNISSGWLLVFLGIALLGFAGYFIWTKVYDRIKEQGV